MTEKKNHYNQEFFDKLAEKLEEIYPKGSKERSSALVFNAYANMIANEIIEKEREEILDFYGKFVEGIEWELMRTAPYQIMHENLKRKIEIEKDILKRFEK